MFLKNYTGLSDAKLIEQLNSNFDYQLFCDIELGFERLTNFKIVSQIRCELSEHLDIHSLEKVLFTSWTQYYKRIATIQKVYEQQQFYFNTGEKIKDRIVSIDKEYLRPIVRGKEVKPVEFGAKVNKIMIDGISFIEHIDFNNFHEGIRLQYGVEKAQILTRKKVHILGADKIYATNKNRSYCSSKDIKTDFVPKGKKPKNYKEKEVLRKAISKERATRLEGSFGKEKAHYHLRKIKARTKKTEILWIFFGIHTGNALEIGRRKSANISQKAA